MRTTSTPLPNLVPFGLSLSKPSLLPAREEKGSPFGCCYAAAQDMLRQAQAERELEFTA
jgi:hypothetical protein